MLHYQLCVLFHIRNICFFLFCVQWLLCFTTSCVFYFTMGISVSFCSVYIGCCTPLLIVYFILQHEYQFHSLVCTVVAVLHYPLCVLFHNRNIIFFCSVYSSCFTPLPIVAFISQQEYQFFSVLCTVVATLHYQMCILFCNMNISLFLFCVQ